MKIRDEIRLHAKEEDKPVLEWLFSKWHMASEWYSKILVTCRFERYGQLSYQTRRIWEPTTAGRILYDNRDKIDAREVE